MGRISYHLRVKALRGDPGFFGGVAKLAGKALKFGKLVPGVGTALTVASMIPRASRRISPRTSVARSPVSEGRPPGDVERWSRQGSARSRAWDLERR